jgi:hypothetical protein
MSGEVCGQWAGWSDVRKLAKYAALTESQVAPWFGPASQILWRLSGRRWQGECPVTGLRPCKRVGTSMVPGVGPPSWGSVADAQRLFWWGRGCGCAWNACDCTVDELWLDPYVPVQSIEEIRIDGAVLAASGYALYDHEFVVRLDGGVWPTTQRLDLADTEVGTWAIDLTWGASPPPDGVLAAAALAAELALAYNPAAGSCALPERIQSVTRQGVTYLISDPQEFLNDGRVGIPLVDLFLRSVNPERRRQAASLGYVGMDRGPSRRT